MSERHINYKFKSKSKFESIKIFGDSIGLPELKLKIAEQAGLGAGCENELFVFDAQTGQEYTNAKQFFSYNTSVLVERRNVVRQKDIIVNVVRIIIRKKYHFVKIVKVIIFLPLLVVSKALAKTVIILIKGYEFKLERNPN